MLHVCELCCKHKGLPQTYLTGGISGPAVGTNFLYHAAQVCAIISNLQTLTNTAGAMTESEVPVDQAV